MWKFSVTTQVKGFIFFDMTNAIFTCHGQLGYHKVHTLYHFHACVLHWLANHTCQPTQVNRLYLLHVLFYASALHNLPTNFNE